MTPASFHAARDAGSVGTVLGVERSLSGRRWVSRPYSERDALALSQRHSLPEVIGRILAARGVGLDDVPTFLDGRLRDVLPDPGHLLGMDTAVERLASAVMQGEQIAVFGDYDVDGATSSALFMRYMQAVACRARLYIPDRLTEGYGPNAKALLGLLADGVSLVVTVDCGTTAHEPLDVARKAGLDVIVVDHHVAEPALPPAVAVVNPNRLDETSPHRQMAAVGVLFLVLVGLSRALRQAGWFCQRPEPNLLGWLDLVALGTVCDVVPLTGINRAYVTQGLKVMAQRGNAGLRALGDIAGVREAPGSYHLGFVLGPRVNAGGRIGHSALGARLLASDDNEEVRQIATQLDAFNRERQSIEMAVLQAAIEQVEEQQPSGRSVLLAAGAGWHPGVLGIVASRLRERFNRPTFVASIDGDVATGSGRSIPGVDLGAAVIAARQAGILQKGGGHPMAAGFTAETAKLDALAAFVSSRIADRVSEATAEPSLRLDGSIDIKAASVSLVRDLERVGPFGSGNPEPRFAITAAMIAYAEPAGTGHVRVMLTGRDGGRLKAIAFRAMDGDVGPALLGHAGKPFHIVGKLRLDTWGGGERPQFFIDDAAPVW